MLKTLYHRLTHRYNKTKAAIRRNKINNKLRSLGNIIGDKVKITASSKLEGKNSIADFCTLNRVSIGLGTYMGTDCYFEKCSIGRYCSIASNVKIVAGSHPTKDFVSTHPAFYSKSFKHFFDYSNTVKYQEFKFADVENKLFAVIENDVWLCTNATILEGVHIGDGAVVAANALVTRDVEPYEIVGGVPAKHIGWRFTEEQRKFLTEFKWWEKDEAWIKEHSDLFDNIEEFIKGVEK